MNEILLAAISAAAGGALAWLARGARVRAAEDQLAERTRELEMLRSEPERRAAAEARAARVPELEAALAESERSLGEHKVRLAEIETRMVEERKAAEEKLALLNDAQQKLSDAFKALSSDALKSNNQSFIELAQATLEKFQEGARGDLEKRQKAVDELVKPIRESLEKVDGKLGEIEKARVSAYSELNTQLKGLVETHLPRLHNETAGLVMRLPGGKQLVVDAKAPVEAYLRAAETGDDETRQAQLADHARQVRDHIVALGRKGYWEQFESTPEFVVLFLPGEMFFSAALQQDPGLIEFGVNEKVIPATPTTLIALLRAVAYGWRQEALAKNAQGAADLGRLPYERIAKLGEHWANVGDKLGRAVEAYNSATTTLESRVLVSARRLRELKAAPDDVEIEAVEPVERTARALQSTTAGR